MGNAAALTCADREDILEVLGPGREVEADEIFEQLDRDGNGDVSIDEMTMLIVNCGKERKDRASSIQDISSAISVLDRIMTIIVIFGKSCCRLAECCD